VEAEVAAEGMRDSEPPLVAALGKPVKTAVEKLTARVGCQAENVAVAAAELEHSLVVSTVYMGQWQQHWAVDKVSQSVAKCEA